MNSNRSIIWNIFIIIIISTIHCALGQPYEPVVYFDAPESHYFAFQEVKYDSINEHYVVRTAKEDEVISIACPSQNGDHSLIIQESVFHKAAVLPVCTNLVKSQTFLSDTQEGFSAVGYLIHTPKVGWTHHFKNIPERHMVVGVIYFKFDEYFKRVKSIWYVIVGGKYLNLKLSREEDEIWKYEKNEDIYRYDLDPLYKQDGCPFVKVPLAPEEDFLFDNWKSATRQNVLTAPMWRDLEDQWQALEIFIRKVARIVNSVTVTTGISGRIMKRPYQLDNSSPKYVYLENENYPIPKYFWKSVTMQFSDDKRDYSYGILFIMHNLNLSDPNSESDDGRRICLNYDIAELGWTFLGKVQLKSPMYGCLLNNKATSRFGEKVIGEFEDFNLNLLSMIEFDDDEKSMVKQVNVVAKIQQMEKETEKM
ncbi:uncharacterized protein LOC135847288 [Planococcus citri]|uniref:uncharacterized protein LOC135847288 n=1 Tax=Planococcus citri TaxID=170843 RepID=UPI0031F8DE23